MSTAHSQFRCVTQSKDFVHFDLWAANKQSEMGNRIESDTVTTNVRTVRGPKLLTSLSWLKLVCLQSANMSWISLFFYVPFSVQRPSGCRFGSSEAEHLGHGFQEQLEWWRHETCWDLHQYYTVRVRSTNQRWLRFQSNVLLCLLATPLICSLELWSFDWGKDWTSLTSRDKVRLRLTLLTRSSTWTAEENVTISHFVPPRRSNVLSGEAANQQ